MQGDRSILHLCSYYIGNKLYRYLFESLENELSKQLVYVPIRSESDRNKNFFDSKITSVFYDNFLKRYHRFFYGFKIKTQEKKLNKYLIENGFFLNDFDVVHAHTLFSDGGTAYLLYRKYGVPYIVNVRNTDINSFYKYALHYRGFSHDVLLNAKSIVFISHSYKSIFFDLLPNLVVKKIKDKCLIIPNGVDNVYFNRIPFVERRGSKLCFFTSARLDKNKNIITVLKIVKSLKEKGIEVNYRVAGEGGEIEVLRDYVENNNLEDEVSFLGYLSSEALIKELDLCDIFILLSYKETFGISYIEALARGKPIIYTQGQGIDGYFPEGHVGYAVQPNDMDAALKAIESILENYDEMVKSCIKESQMFNWPSISKKYLETYF